MYDQIAANKRRTWIILSAFLGLVYAVAWIIGQYQGNNSFTVSALVIAAVYALISYFSAGKLAVMVNGAKEIQKKDNPRLWRTVENLAITNGMPMPKVYIIDDPALNAFATGRDPNHAIVAATTGLLNAIDDTELQGVMAHELGHVQNFDIRVSMIAFALVTAVGLIVDMFWRMHWFGGGRDRDNQASGIFALLAIVSLILAPIVATMLQMSVSRKREYLADATGALTTRYPEGLASALEKIGAYGSKLRRQNTSTAHLFIANPLRGQSVASLFSTHPPVEERIRRLREMTV